MGRYTDILVLRADASYCYLNMINDLEGPKIEAKKHGINL